MYRFYNLAGTEIKIDSLGREFKKDNWLGWIKADLPQHDIHAKSWRLLEIEQELKGQFSSAIAYEMTVDAADRLRAEVKNDNSFKYRMGQSN